MSFNNLEISSNFGVKMTSIRLFLAFPSAVSFDAIGAYSPLPAAVKFSGRMEAFSLKMFTIAVARLVERSQFQLN